MKRENRELHFINLASKIHENLYDYSLVNYVNCYEKVKIICKIHGIFEQSPTNHTSRKSGCKKCHWEYTHKIHKLSKSEFISRAKDIYGDLYDYSQTEYVNNHTPVTIICSIHGEFKKTAANHIHGRQGCPWCSNRSKGELAISKWLSDNEIMYESEYYFNECRNQRDNKLPFDFYIKSKNTIIEFDGEQHRKPIRFNGIDEDRAKQLFEQTIAHDSIKNDFAIKSNIQLIRIAKISDIPTLLSHLTN